MVKNSIWTLGERGFVGSWLFQDLNYFSVLKRDLKPAKPHFGP